MGSRNSWPIDCPNRVYARYNIQQVRHNNEQKEGRNEREKLSTFFFACYPLYQAKQTLDAPLKEILYTRGNQITSASAKIEECYQYNDRNPGT
jgi:hypothetical protein